MPPPPPPPPRPPPPPPPRPCAAAKLTARIPSNTSLSPIGVSLPAGPAAPARAAAHPAAVHAAARAARATRRTVENPGQQFERLVRLGLLVRFQAGIDLGESVGFDLG